MRDSAPMNKTRHKILIGVEKALSGPPGRSITIEQMRKNFRAIYQYPEAMIEARKRALQSEL